MWWDGSPGRGEHWTFGSPQSPIIWGHGGGSITSSDSCDQQASGGHSLPPTIPNGRIREEAAVSNLRPARGLWVADERRGGDRTTPRVMGAAES